MHGPLFPVIYLASLAGAHAYHGQKYISLDFMWLLQETCSQGALLALDQPDQASDSGLEWT